MKKRIVLTAFVMFLGLICVMPNRGLAAKKPKLSAQTVQLFTKKTKKLTVKNNKAKVTWKSKNKKVATVTKKGVIKGISAGKTKVTAAFKVKKKKKTLSCTVKVKSSTYAVAGKVTRKSSVFANVKLDFCDIKSGKVMYTTTTSQTGTYSLKLLEGKYAVKYNGILLKTINVTATTKKMDFATNANEISGTITYSLVKYAASTYSVKLMQNNKIISECSTDKNGSFKLYALTKGTYQICVANHTYSVIISGNDVKDYKITNVLYDLNNETGKNSVTGEAYGPVTPFDGKNCLQSLYKKYKYNWGSIWLCRFEIYNPYLNVDYRGKKIRVTGYYQFTGKDNLAEVSFSINETQPSSYPIVHKDTNVEPNVWHKVDFTFELSSDAFNSDQDSETGKYFPIMPFYAWKTENGDYSAGDDFYFADYKYTLIDDDTNSNTYKVSGHVQRRDNKFNNAKLDICNHYQEDTILYSIQTDDNGNYSLNLPNGYYDFKLDGAVVGEVKVTNSDVVKNLSFNKYKVSGSIDYEFVDYATGEYYYEVKQNGKTICSDTCYANFEFFVDKEGTYQMYVTCVEDNNDNPKVLVYDITVSGDDIENYVIKNKVEEIYRLNDEVGSDPVSGEEWGPITEHEEEMCVESLYNKYKDNWGYIWICRAVLYDGDKVDYRGKRIRVTGHYMYTGENSVDEVSIALTATSVASGSAIHTDYNVYPGFWQGVDFTYDIPKDIANNDMVDPSTGQKYPIMLYYTWKNGSSYLDNDFYFADYKISVIEVD